MAYLDLDKTHRGECWKSFATASGEVIPNPTSIVLELNAHHKNHWEGEELMAEMGDTISANWAGDVSEIATATSNDSFWSMKFSSPNDSQEIWASKLMRIFEWINSSWIPVPPIDFVNQAGAFLKSKLEGQFSSLELSFHDLSGATLPLLDVDQGWTADQFPIDGDYSIVTNQTPVYWMLTFYSNTGPTTIYGVNLFELMLTLDPLATDPIPTIPEGEAIKSPPPVDQM